MVRSAGLRFDPGGLNTAPTMSRAATGQNVSTLSQVAQSQTQTPPELEAPGELFCFWRFFAFISALRCQTTTHPCFVRSRGVSDPLVGILCHQSYRQT